MIGLKELDVSSKRVFLRADIDLVVKNGRVAETERIELLLPTIRYLISLNSLTLIAGHIGRPQETGHFGLSTKSLATIFYSLLNLEVVHFSRLEDVELLPNTLGLLENLRFWPEEEKNDQNFSRKLALLADVYVNEAFAASHRAHASTVGVPGLLPHAAGFRLEKEVEVLAQVLKNPKRPFVVIIGGAKIETKLPVIENLAKIADFVLVGGALTRELAKRVHSSQFTVDRVLPATPAQDGMDIDAASIKKFKEIIKQAKTLIWNGPMGIFEEEKSEKGTKEIAQAVANSSAFKIVGGGETIFALKKFGVFNKMDWVSSGGGAMLEFLSGKTLPGIEALR